MFKYEVEFWADWIKPYGKMMKETGLVTAKTWGEATDKVKEFYGDQTITVKVEQWDEILTIDHIKEGLGLT